MRPAIRPPLLAGIFSFIATGSALSIWQQASPRHPDLRATQQQQPILSGPIIVMPPSSTNPPPNDPAAGAAGGPGTVILSDVMGRDRSINIFAGLVRDVASISKRLDDESQNSTVLAPLNSAMEKMPRKPWEDAQEYGALGAEAYEGDEGWERAQKNIRRFVERHVVPVNPWKEGEKVETVGGGQVWWETNKEGEKVVSGFACLPSMGVMTDCLADTTGEYRGGQCCELCTKWTSSMSGFPFLFC